MTSCRTVAMVTPQRLLSCVLVVVAGLLPCSAFHSVLVPHDAQSGYVIASLPFWGQDFILDPTSSSRQDADRYFSVLKNGDVVTRSSISSLIGEKLSLRIRSQESGRDTSWKETLHLIIKHRDSIITFPSSRYEGSVMENAPVGTTVSGLEDLKVSTFSGVTPRDIHYRIVSGATGRFEVIQPSGLSNRSIVIRTTEVLDREESNKWFLELEASTDSDPVYTKIKIHVMDQNDNVPTFQQDFYHATIKDSTPLYSEIVQVSATDPDRGGVRYFMDPHTVFSVDSTTGSVIIKSKPDPAMETYVIQIYAKDDGGNRTDNPANVQIDLDRNLYYDQRHAGRHHHDRRTRWKRDTLTTREVEVMENMVGKLLDLPNNVHERFAFKEPVPDALEIDPVTGAVRLRQDKHLDYEKQPEIEFVVRITREDNPGYERDQPIHIRLTDVNDEVPQFINLPRPFLATVSPNAGPANFVYQLIAQDDDQDSFIRFNLESGGEDRFEVDPETGIVRTRGNQPFRQGKEYEIGVSAEDIRAPTLQKSMTHSLKILVGDRSPQFYETQYKAAVPETAPEGFEIVRIQAKSHQAFPLSFMLTTESESQSNEFAINSETGVVDLLRPLDYEKNPAEYHLRVMAVEHGRPSLTSTVSLIIHVVDMNDNSPTFPLSQYIIQGIAETVQTGADIMQVTATDVDSVTNSQLTYSVNDGNFTVQTFNNIGYIRTHKRLDYDAIYDHTYNFTVTAVDNGSPAHTGSAQVRVSVSNVNDEDPQFMQPVEHVQVSEDASINTVVHVVQAYDPDGDRVTYSFTGDRGNHLIEGPFSIDPQSGILTLVDQLVKSQVTYRLNVTATDDGSCCGSTTSRANTGLVIVEVKDVNNNAPRFTQCGSYAPEVAEKESVGTAVIRVEATDPDTGANGNITYSLVKSSDQSNINFYIEPSTGILRTADVFDREGQVGVTDFGVTIKAEDQGNPKLAGFCTFRVKIGDKNDNPPVFNLPHYSTSIEENSVIGKKVKQVYAMDRDAGLNGQVEYFIRSDPSNFFTINQHSGWVSVARPMEGRDRVELIVEARDRGTPTKSSTVQMDIEITKIMNAYPQWVEDYSQQPIRISENVKVNHIVARLKATSSMPNSFVNYFIQNGETAEQNGPPRSFYYRFDEENNEMILMTYRTLDYETISEYSLTIKAANRAYNSIHNDTRLIIELQDENDEIPQFIGIDENGRYPGSVAENLEAGAEVISVTATDRDEFKRFRKINYSIKPLGPDFHKFVIDRQTGLVRTTTTFDREHKSEYYITVIAEDGAPSDRPNHHPPGTPNQGEAEVQVRITDKNDNSPYFKKSVYHAEVAENADIGILVLHVTAEDKDEGNALSYSISGGNIGNSFEVHPTQGDIKVRGHLDYDQGIRTYDLTYRVFDDKFANTTQIIISVIDVNDNPPRFDHSIYNMTDINEEEMGISSGNPKYLLSVRATDPDTERDSNLRYSLTGQFVDDGTFMVNEYTGEIYVNRPLNRDKPWGRPIWNFNVLAHDEVGSGHSLTGYAEVRVMPRDINDNAPEFDRSRLRGSIPENSDGGRPVLTVIAEDRDNGNNGTVMYSLRQVPMVGTTPLFSIDPSSGLITTMVSDSLDRETQEEYKIIVVAKDRGIDPQSSTATVTIIVTDINDHKPRFTQAIYSAVMSENYAVGASITSVSATDGDIGSNAALTYRLRDTDSEFFSISTVKATNTGVLKVYKAVDYDTLLRPSFNLTVYVHDPIQDGSHSDTAHIEVRVTDYNDNPPAFQPPTHQVRIYESVKVGTTLARFKATDRDTGNNKEFHYDIDRSTDPLRQFSIDSDGLVMTTALLDREVEQTHRIHILAIDHGSPAQTGVGTLIINLMDVNDNFPIFAEDYRPVIYENEPAGRTVAIISAKDRDTASNGPPFEMWLPCGGVCPCEKNPVCGLFTFKFEAGRGDQGYGVGTVRSLTKFDREQRKQYLMPIIMRDSGEPAMSGTNTLTITIGDKNDNKHFPGHKDIFVYNYKGWKGTFENAPLGNVYAEDEDDWDVDNKTFRFVNPGTKKYFKLDVNSGMLSMRGRVPAGTYNFQVNVYDVVHQRRVDSTVTVTLRELGDDAVFNSGSIRLRGMTAEQFVARPLRPGPAPEDTRSPADTLAALVGHKLGVPSGNVDVFTIMNHPTLEATIDVRFSAHGSPYYRPVKLDGLIQEHKAEFERALRLAVVMSPIDECLREVCESGGCANVLNVTSEPLLINTNGTSLIGITSVVTASCRCQARTFDSDDDVQCRPDSCVNGGKCLQREYDFVCECPEGFSGARCQMTHHSFQGDGWAWYKPLAQCEHSHTSLEFMTTEKNGILLYNGPLGAVPDGGDTDFILLEMRGGYPYLQIDHGSGVAMLTVDGRDDKHQKKLYGLNDGQWHRVDIYREARVVRMVIDNCKSAIINENENVQTSFSDTRPCEAVSETPGESKYINVNTPLQLGGVADLANNGYVRDKVARDARGFHGCVKNLVHDGELYDLYIGKVGRHHNSRDGCPTEDFVCGLDLGLEAATPKCGRHGQCVGSLLKNKYHCQCEPGWRGQRCAIPTTTKDFGADSFIEWDFKDHFYAGLDAKLFSTDLQLMFRTRRPKGLLFKVQNVQKSEYLRLEIVRHRLRFRYNLGSGETSVSLAHVNVSDGQWHTARVDRQGQWVSLSIDSGEGRFYNETRGHMGDHKHIRVSQRSIFAGGDVRFPSSNSPPIVKFDFEDSCMNDVRYNGEWFPMDHSQNKESSAANLTQSDHLREGCVSAACVPGGGAGPGRALGAADGDPPLKCDPPLVCYDLWRAAKCGCPEGQELSSAPGASTCVNINECVTSPCMYGRCVDHDRGFSCTCEPGYGGDLCAMPHQTNIASFNIGFILAIVICTLVLLLIVLIFFVYSRRRRPESYTVGVDPDDDVRENIIHYDEEGVGEEDQDAYDINRLKKPLDCDGYTKLPSAEKPLPVQPEKPRKKAVYKPGEMPDVGTYIKDRLQDADGDPHAPPHDSVREYAYEGAGSTAGSLSSLASTSDPTDHSYDYLNDWGPRFNKLADMYGGNNGGPSKK